MKTTKPANILVRIKQIFKKTKKIQKILELDRFTLIDDFRPDATRSGHGSYGEYYHKDNIGHKVMYGIGMTLAEKEFDNLKKAHDKFPYLFPKPYKLFKFKDKSIIDREVTRYGYTMEHIDMLLVKNATFEKCEFMQNDIFIGILNDVLYEMGIEHRDLHQCNVMYSPETGNFKIIDADPQFLSIKNEEVI